MTQSSASPASTAASAPAPAATPTPTTQFALKTDSANDLPNLASSVDFYPGINSTLSTSNPGPVQWPQSRPTLTGGSVAGRMSGLSYFQTLLSGVSDSLLLSGTPAQIARPPDDPSVLTADDTRTRRKSTPGDQSMRRTIQDLVSSIDPNVKIEPDVEDVGVLLGSVFLCH